MCLPGWHKEPGKAQNFGNKQWVFPSWSEASRPSWRRTLHWHALWLCSFFAIAASRVTHRFIAASCQVFVPPQRKATHFRLAVADRPMKKNPTMSDSQAVGRRHRVDCPGEVSTNMKSDPLPSAWKCGGEPCSQQNWSVARLVSDCLTHWAKCCL